MVEMGGAMSFLASTHPGRHAVVVAKLGLLRRWLSVPLSAGCFRSGSKRVRKIMIDDEFPLRTSGEPGCNPA